MRPGARLAAAIEVLTEIMTRGRPAALSLSDWGKAHRFAGSGDRSAIGNLVYDVLRSKRSLAARMGSDDPRALVVAAARTSLGLSESELISAADGSKHAISPLSDSERAALASSVPDDAIPSVAADLPDWLVPSMTRVFGEGLISEARALARRAPVDIRVNTLKADRDKVLRALAEVGAEPTPHSPIGLRVPHGRAGRRTPNVEAEASHGKGWFEVQDEGSQIAALLAGAGPREQVLDLCAGAGGKTLALGLGMQNTGQIFAYDRDRNQLRPIFERIRRAALRNVQVMDAGREAELLALGPRFDLVFVDAPCTGSGVWRRRPDAKWRVKPQNLTQRLEEQADVLATGAKLVKPGGRLVYVTCSLLPEENVDQVAAFLDMQPDFRVVPYRQAWQNHISDTPPDSADGADDTLLLSPHQHGTDGFFIAILQRDGPEAIAT
ncbi:MAG: RsmB/NOP family class I SAM-dependent RNA methyltransferase [Pseudomonadota bacterium]